MFRIKFLMLYEDAQSIYVCKFFVLCGGRWRRVRNDLKRRNHVTSKSNAPDTDKSRVAIGVVWKAKTAARRPERLGDQ